VAFGVASAALGVDPADATSALLLMTANALLQAAMRLGRISHRDAQAILHRLRPAIAAAVEGPSSCDTDSPLTLTPSLEGERAAGALRSFHPLQEIASMRHERAEARLFAS
jgi:urease accessory protein UreF